jgi:hypothetical protein
VYFPSDDPLPYLTTQGDCDGQTDGQTKITKQLLNYEMGVGHISKRCLTTNKSYPDLTGRTCSVILGLDREPKKLRFSSNSCIHIEPFRGTLGVEC